MQPPDGFYMHGVVGEVMGGRDLGLVEVLSGDATVGLVVRLLHQEIIFSITSEWNEATTGT